MLDTLQNIVRIPDLRKRIIFVALMMFVFRIGAHIHVPGVDWAAIDAMSQTSAGGLMGFLDMFSGGALSQLTVFALGIMPYISASIILQLLTVVVPALEKLSKEGELGRKKITQYTRYGTVLISVVQGTALTFFYKTLTATIENQSRSVLTSFAQDNELWWQILTVITLTAGTSFIMWIGEQITERGIGNGISLLIFAGIIVKLPGGIIQAIASFTGAVQDQSNTFSPFKLLIVIILTLGLVAVIVFVERGQRRIPVSYAKRVVGRKIYGGQSTYVPLRINTAGVIPVIFASSIMMLPQWIFGALAESLKWDWLRDITNMLNYGHLLYLIFYIAAIMFFCFFYTQIVFNPKDVADNMKKYGSFIPGKRPGKRTAEYISTVLNRVTAAGAVYLGLISLIPILFFQGIRLDSIPVVGRWVAGVLPDWITKGLDMPMIFAGTSLLIVIGVAMDFVQQLESQLVMRHYDGFFKGSRIRGRR